MPPIGRGRIQGIGGAGISFGRSAFPACAAVGWKNQAASSAAPQLFTFEEFAADGFTHLQCYCP
jgi:hypothetical protein